MEVGVGAAQVQRKPTFSLSGTDVTGSLPLYGVLLGADMVNTEHKPATTVGFGVLRPVGSMYLDVAYRLTYIATDGGPTRLHGLHVGVGLRF